jgi:curli biogenesis system outer membrane secretion channel CsgG
MMLKGFAVSMFLVLGFTTAGCGYALVGQGTFLPEYINVVGIPQLVNTTTFFQVEQILTEKIRTEFIGRGRYTVITAPEGADAVVTGAVTSINVQPVGFTDQQLASRYLFTLTMRVEFTDTRTREVLWANSTLAFREEYELETRGDQALEGASFLSQERSSFDRIADDVARTVVTAIVEAF